MANISNISSNEFSDVGGIAYFRAYISDYLPYVILVSFGTVIGVIGNLIIMLTIIINRELHSPTYMLMFNLAIADIFISGFVDSTAIHGVFVGKMFFTNQSSLCTFIGFTCFTGCIASLSSLLFLSINRYVNICRHDFYKKAFTVKLTLLYCILIWLVGILLSLINLSGWNKYSFDEKSLSCIWNRLGSLSNIYYTINSYIILPSVVIFLFYFRIFIFAFKSRNTSISSSASKSIRLAKILFGSFMLFIVCWLPYGLVVMIDIEDKLPRSVIMFSMALGHLNSSLNPIFYLVFNCAFRRGFVNLLKKFLCCF